MGLINIDFYQIDNILVTSLNSVSTEIYENESSDVIYKYYYRFKDNVPIMLTMKIGDKFSLTNNTLTIPKYSEIQNKFPLTFIKEYGDTTNLIETMESWAECINEYNKSNDPDEEDGKHEIHDNTNVLAGTLIGDRIKGRLSVKLWTINNFLFMKVLDQPMQIRGTGPVSLVKTKYAIGKVKYKLNIKIVSEVKPYLTYNTIGVRGTNRLEDDSIVYCEFDDNKSAKMHMILLRSVIEEYNSKIAKKELQETFAQYSVTERCLKIN